MKATQKLYRAGQSLWLDNITRDLLTSGTLKRYIDELSITGLTSNPTIFDQAIKKGTAYDEAIRERLRAGESGDDLFFEIAVDDITRAADLFRPVHERTSGVDGWVSLEVSPLLAHDTQTTLAEARDLHARVGRPNVFIKIPGTAEGLPAIEAAIFAGIPINVTLLFSAEQYLAAAEACLRGIERRISRRIEPERRLGRVGVHQPLGRCGGRPGAGESHQHARNRSRQTHLQSLFEPHRLSALASCVQCGCASPATPLRQHRHEGSRQLPTSCTSGSSLRRSPSTPRPKRRSRRSPITGRSVRR